MLGYLKRALSGPRTDLYGLDHAVLNVQLPPQSMWMNMGYWEVSVFIGLFKPRQGYQISR